MPVQEGRRIKRTRGHATHDTIGSAGVVNSEGIPKLRLMTLCQGFTTVLSRRVEKRHGTINTIFDYVPTWVAYGFSPNLSSALAHHCLVFLKMGTFSKSSTLHFRLPSLSIHAPSSLLFNSLLSFSCISFLLTPISSLASQMIGV